MPGRSRSTVKVVFFYYCATKIAPTKLTFIQPFHSFIHQWLYSPLLGPGLSFSCVIIFTHTVGFIGWVISPSQGRYLHTGQHKHRINAHTDINALSGIRIHDLSVLASEDSSYLRPRGHRDRQIIITLLLSKKTLLSNKHAKPKDRRRLWIRTKIKPVVLDRVRWDSTSAIRKRQESLWWS
jgi:hypothetical protein